MPNTTYAAASMDHRKYLIAEGPTELLEKIQQHPIFNEAQRAAAKDAISGGGGATGGWDGSGPDIETIEGWYLGTIEDVQQFILDEYRDQYGWDRCLIEGRGGFELINAQ